MEAGESVFVAAHTSAGKTAVAEYAVALAAAARGTEEAFLTLSIFFFFFLGKFFRSRSSLNSPSLSLSLSRKLLRNKKNALFLPTRQGPLLLPDQDHLQPKVPRL